MLYTVCFTKIMCSLDSLDPGHCPWTSILEFLKIGQVSFSPCSLHIYKCNQRRFVYAYMCMLIYVCLSTCVYVCECVHVQFCMKTNVLMNEHSISHLFSCKIEHAHTHTHTHMYTHTQINIHKHTHIPSNHMHIYTYTNIYTCIESS